MKKIVLIFSIALVLFSCKSDDDNQNDNPFLFNPIVSLNLNLNLPQYNSLRFPGGQPVIITSQGVKGIAIYNVNGDLYIASEISDPNHIPSTCSAMEVNDIILSCPCSDDLNEYNIVTGQHTSNQGLYPLQQYRAERNGDDIHVFN